jgi:hypothetical protein
VLRLAHHIYNFAMLEIRGIRNEVLYPEIEPQQSMTQGT